MSAQAEYDYICPVCHEVFRVPVILPCGHSFCQQCVRQFWSGRRARECPVCRRSSRHVQPVVNLALKNLCEEFEKRKKQSRAEDMCSLHREKLKLFCLQDNQPVCVVCFTSQQHDQHTLRPVAEAAAARKDQLSAALKSLQEKLQHREKTKEELQKTLLHIRVQAEQTERQIRLEFQKLHQFLREEEEASVSAVREEEEQKQRMMKEKLEEINKHISDLSLAIRDTQESMSSSSIRFLQEFPVSMERLKISQPDSQMPAGALINESLYLTNLMLRVWWNMQDVSERRIILLGGSDAGKIASGNTILGRREFGSEWSPVTSECSVAHARVSGRSVSVVNTPGLSHTDISNEETMMKEICRSVSLSSPGPHAFLIVFRIERLAILDQQIPPMMEMFGEEVFKYSIILFTGRFQLTFFSNKWQVCNENYIKQLIKENSGLRCLVDQCGGRYRAFTNRDENNRDQVEGLLQKIDSMIQQNEGGHYTNQMLEDALRRRRENKKRTES